ncbi:spermine/spermidine synthase domain-containing protein [Thermomonospora amylolytica]|uniref:spermine/spermidine synthase domain-containing protein n=1 Tax=Thermomonospora amylolytica TaxID=1411117 RepID=UPI000E6C9869|nr:spermidine synthase [Thermomonospora amylolytica]
MSRRFEELDWRPTPMGEISLRRRRDPVTGEDVYEVKLDDDFLMSSLFTAGEIALARLGLEPLPRDADLDVLVGGLGLGYTAHAVLQDPRVRSLVVVEALGEVIEWHRRRLVPLGGPLAEDARCRLVREDFFAVAAGRADPPGGPFHAVIVDIDHSPRHVLNPAHAAFYEPEGLRRLTALLHDGGVFALWSNDPPDERFERDLAAVFAETRTHVVEFPNPQQDRPAANTVYVAQI